MTATEYLRKWWGASIVLVAFACLVATGFIGLDFGRHWDEPVQLQLVNATIANRSFLPNHFYNYPSVTYLLSLLGVLPRVLTGIGNHKTVSGNQFFVPARAVFLVATSLGGIWLYLGLRRRAGELGAAFGAATYLLSFELAYHARWIAPDAVMAMMTALFLWFFVIAWDSPGSRWRMTLPALAAGLATATKYQGAVLMVPVVVLFVKQWRADPTTVWAQVRGLLQSVAAFLVTFLILTPGAILQRSDFINDVRRENHHYRSGHAYFHGAFPYNVTDHLTYFSKLTRYVVVSLPSHSPLISLLVVGLAIIGVVTLAQRELWFAIALLLPCLIIVLYFSTLVVFIVRNFLLLLPFLAFFAGIGVGRVAEIARSKIAFSLLVAGLSALMIINGAWLVHASQTIADRSPAELVRASSSFMRDRPGKRFVLSRPMQKRFRTYDGALPKNARTRGSADYLVVLYSQIRSGQVGLREWPATSRGTYRVVGPLEVNFDYYPTWDGDDRVLFITPEEARRFGLARTDLAIAP